MNKLPQRHWLRAVSRRTVYAAVFGLALTCSADGAYANGASPAGPVPATLQQRLAACTSCHGTHGEGSVESQFFPRLAGKPADYLARQLRYFRDGQRKYAPMQNIVQQLEPAYLQEMADYFSRQQVAYRRSAIPALSAAVMARGEQLVSQGDPSRALPACASCHGRSLNGVEPNIPALVGLPYDYVSSQLGSWRTGTRAAAAPDCMAQIAHRLTPGDISAVSAWLATQQPPADVRAQPAGSVKPPLRCGVLGAPGGGA